MNRKIVVVRFDEKKVKRLEWAHDLCLGSLYVIKVANEFFNISEKKSDFNPPHYFIDVVFIGSISVYSEEGYYQREKYLFAEINEKNIYEIHEPEHQVFLDEQFNIRSRNL